MSWLPELSELLVVGEDEAPPSPRVTRAARAVGRGTGGGREHTQPPQECQGPGGVDPEKPILPHIERGMHRP